ncbi:molybdopterin-dependent oxidoreductase [Halorussus marinus]|uniref:molybdopterin-dependent oxidoreductase n=1 Tax=Halorussus marinus TaxID=2505976 RepID=UPI00106EAEBA|nr:molybdopterin-dependent oxidoreductase [Halorussus marinus]
MRASDDASGTESVTVIGDAAVSVPSDPRRVGDDTRVATREWSFRCASGDEIAGPWSGIALDELLAAADPPDATTHLAVEGEDGYRACVPIADALDGLLAYRRAGAACGGAPRFLAPGVSGVRTVKRVARIEALELPAGADPEDREALVLAEK